MKGKGRGGVVELALKYMDEEISNETHHCSIKSNLLIPDKLYRSEYLFTVVVINTTFNNISVISWESDLLVEEPEYPGENHRPVANH